MHSLAHKIKEKIQRMQSVMRGDRERRAAWHWREKSEGENIKLLRQEIKNCMEGASLQHPLHGET